MKKQYDDRNRGALWRNENQREGKQDPDLQGKLNVDGTEFYVSAWKRKPGANPKSPALSFSIRLAEERPPSGQRSGQAHVGEYVSREPGSDDDFDDSIPW